jgi:isopropylmalate/homocitrate/citramalate synthase
MLGIGERTGNCPLEAMAIEYASLRGTTDGMDLSVITEIARYFEDEIGYEIPARTPFVGRNFNVTRAGIHADGLLKDEEIYNIFNTAKILNRPASVAVDSHSGLAGIAHWINSFFRLIGEEAIDKRSEIVIKMKEAVDAEYVAGRNTVMGDGELETILREINWDEYNALTHIHLHHEPPKN